MMKTLSFCDFSSNDLWNFISNDDTNEFLEIWTDDDRDTNTNDSTFKNAVPFKRKTHSKTLLCLQFILFQNRCVHWKETTLKDIVKPRFTYSSIYVLSIYYFLFCIALNSKYILKFDIRSLLNVLKARISNLSI